MLQVTKDAVEQIKEELEHISTDVTDPYIRAYMSIGWGGSRLQLALEESTNPNDTVTEVSGIKFLVDASQKTYFEDVKLDFTDGFYNLINN